MELGSTDSKSNTLELPLTGDPLAVYLKNIPTASDLSKRLKVQIVSDPLADKTGAPLQENNLLK